MSNLKLVPDAPTPLERLLLEASRGEVPSDDHKAKLRAALGISAPMSGPFAAPPPSVAPRAEPLASNTGLVVKVAGAFAGALTILAALWWLPERAPHAVAPLTAKVPAAVVTAESARAQNPAPTPAVSPLPPIEPQPASEEERAASRPRRPAAPNVGEPDDLSEQMRLLEAARAGVASRDPRAAFAALDSYKTRFPRGSFGQEASVLRIRAVELSGDPARASAMARAFIARFPSSPHVARLKPIAERGSSR